MDTHSRKSRQFYRKIKRQSADGLAESLKFSRRQKLMHKMPDFLGYRLKGKKRTFISTLTTE
jgi:hypothetical protein